MKARVCMIGPDINVKGGISSVVKGYLNSTLVEDYSVQYLSSHIDGGKIKKFFKALLAYAKFICVCIIKKPNIVHIHSSFGASFYRKSLFIIISKLFRIPVVNHIHGAEFDRFYTNASVSKKKLIRNIYSKQDVTVVLSKEWVKLFKEIVPKGKICKVENFAIMPSELIDIKEKENLVLFLGEVGKRKGAYDIPQVIEEIVKHRCDIKFVICGNGDIENIKELLEHRGLSDYAIFTGWINSTERDMWLNRSKVFFLPTYNEGLPMSILEGMAYGLPIVSTNVGGIPTLIKNNINGYICAPGRVKDFANSILGLFSNDALYKEIHNNNILKVKSGYSLESNIKRIKNIYKMI